MSNAMVQIGGDTQLEADDVAILAGSICQIVKETKECHASDDVISHALDTFVAAAKAAGSVEHTTISNCHFNSDGGSKDD